MTEIKLRDSDFRYIEKLLYDQKTHDEMIEQLEQELEDMLPAYSKSVIKFSHDKPHKQTSQPEDYAIERNESIRAIEIKEEINKRKRQKSAVSEATKYMDETENQIIYLRYQCEKPHSHVARKVGMWDFKEKGPSRTYWRTRRRILEKVARFVLV